MQSSKSKPFGRVLKQARESRNWAQSDVAEKLGVSLSAVSRWERNLAWPTPYHRQKLCELLEEVGPALRKLVRRRSSIAHTRKSLTTSNRKFFRKKED